MCWNEYSRSSHRIPRIQQRRQSRSITILAHHPKACAAVADEVGGMPDQRPELMMMPARGRRGTDEDVVPRGGDMREMILLLGSVDTTICKEERNVSEMV
jgi:hypothetical protein